MARSKPSIDLDTFTVDQRMRIARASQRSISNNSGLIFGLGGAVLTGFFIVTSPSFMMEVGAAIGVRSLIVPVAFGVGTAAILALCYRIWDSPRLQRDIYINNEIRKALVAKKEAEKQVKIDQLTQRKAMEQ